MKKRTFVILAVCALLICSGMTPAQEAGVYGLPDFYVQVGGWSDSIEYLNSADETAYTVGWIPAGEILHVTDLVYNRSEDTFWALISYDGMSGWIRLAQAEIMRAIAVDEPEENEPQGNADAAEDNGAPDYAAAAPEDSGANVPDSSAEPIELIVFVSIAEEQELLETPGGEVVAVVTDTTPLYFYGEEVIPEEPPAGEPVAKETTAEEADVEESGAEKASAEEAGAEEVGAEEAGAEEAGPAASYFSWLKVSADSGETGWVRSDQVIMASSTKFLAKKEIRREEERRLEEEQRLEEERRLEEEQGEPEEGQQELPEQEAEPLPEDSENGEIAAYNPDFTGSFADYEAGRIITVSEDAIIDERFDPETWEPISAAAYYYVARPANLRPDEASWESVRIVAFNNNDASDAWILFYDPYTPDTLVEEFKTGDAPEESRMGFSRTENQ